MSEPRRALLLARLHQAWAAKTLRTGRGDGGTRTCDLWIISHGVVPLCRVFAQHAPSLSAPDVCPWCGRVAGCEFDRTREAWGLAQPAPAPPPPLAPPVAAAKAKARFWSLLADFAELGQSWDGLSEEGHPFLVRDGDGVAVVVPP